tara:strand:- start:1532 stop:2221 length:690 start_codon:yes stop_codon:yes gene_type:complete
MAITLTTLRAQVRDMADLDETDLPNSLIDQFAREGFQRIYALERRWPILQETYTFNTVANQREYTISTIGDIREIISIVDTSTQGARLTLIDYNQAEETWLGNLDVPSRPYFFSFWDKKIQLWAKPDIVYPMTVRAFRNPVYTWLTDITENIDLDEFFHAILPYFVLARVYQRQEDAQLAAMYLGTFEEGVAIAKRDLMKASSAQPVIMSGGKQYPTMRRWLQTLGRTL